MFFAEPWARAFIAAFPFSAGAEMTLEAALDVLELYCHAALRIPGKLFGRAAASRLAPLVGAALAKALPESAGALYAENFFLLMVRKGCFYRYPSIIKQIRKLVNEHNGLKEIVLEAPFECNSVFLESIKGELLQKTGARKIKLESRVVSGLEGGLRLRMGSFLFDGSLRARMEQMAADLSAEGGK
jgi:F0F1-type ATP synthase delta subunit